MNGARAITGLLACVVLAGTAPARAHSASDAYLTLAVAQGPTTGIVVEGQWDIALRDLHFVHKLDDDGDGSVTWGEVRAHEADIARIAYARLRIAGDGAACPIEPTRLLVTTRADGAYAALLFRAVCDKHPQELAVEYKLFVDVDPTHRGIAVIRTATGTATALFAPDNERVALTLAGPLDVRGRSGSQSRPIPMNLQEVPDDDPCPCPPVGSRLTRFLPQ